MIVSLAVGIVVWISIIGAGYLLAKEFPFRARPAAGGDAAIVARRGERDGAAGLRAEIWVDAAVTGRYWGKTLRTIIEDRDCGRFIVYAPWARRGKRMESGGSILLPSRRARCSPRVVVYLGFQGELVSIGGNGEDDTEVVPPEGGKVSVIILHPTVFPPADGRANRPGEPQQDDGSAGGFALPEIQQTWQSALRHGLAARATFQTHGLAARATFQTHGLAARATFQTHGLAARATFQTHGLAARATFTVCLPAVDGAAHNLSWRRWAEENGARVVFSPQGGIRIDTEQNREFWRALLFDEDQF